MSNIINTLKNVLTFNLNSKVLEKFTLYFIMIFLVTVQLGGFVSEIKFYDKSYMSNLYVIITMIILLIYTTICFIKKKKIDFSLDILFLSIFIIYSLISTFFSKDIITSIFGTIVRRDGLISLLLYYLIYLNGKCIATKDNIIKIINISFGIGIIQAIVGIIQSFGNGNILFIAKYWDHMAYGFCGNPNFFGTYMMVLCLLGISLIVFYKDVRLYHKICTVFFFVGLVLASSTGPFLTFCFMFLIIILIIKFRHLNIKYHDCIVILSAIIVLLFTVINYSNIYVNNIYEKYWYEKITDEETISGDVKIISSKLINKVCKLFSGIEPLQVTNVSDNKVGSGRLDIWKNTINYIKVDNRIWFGSGPDNFRMPGGYITKYNNYGDKMNIHITYDKAHNVYLNYVATTGIFSLIAYLLWTITIHVKGIKNRHNDITLILLLVFIGYNIQSLLNINVIEVTPYYYLFAGLMMGIECKVK